MTGVDDLGTTTGHAHPATSFEAAARALPRSGTQRRKIYDFIVRAPQGATDDEIAAVLRIPGNSVRPRRVELAQAGLITRAGYTRQNKSFNACDVWRAT